MITQGGDFSMPASGDISVPVDIDLPKPGDDDATCAGKLDSYERIKWAHGAVLVRCAAVNTGGGGRHFFFRHPGSGVHVKTVAPIGKGTDSVLYGIDCRGDGGYVLPPPSNHVSGGAYSWASGHELPKT